MDVKEISTMVEAMADSVIKSVDARLAKNAGEVEAAIKGMKDGGAELRAQLLETQQMMTKLTKASFVPDDQSDVGRQFAEIIKSNDELFERLRKGTGHVQLDLPAGLMRKALVNATGASQPLVAAERLATIVGGAERRLTLRDLIPVAKTESNSIEYARETSFTNNAAIVYSSPNRENVTKPESLISFELKRAGVETIAHWTKASKQILDDSSMLQQFLEHRMTFGLKLAEEDEILNGDGSAGHLDGLMHLATAYAGSGAVSSDTQIDTLRRAIAQLQVANYDPTAIVLNPVDWMKIELIKDTQGKYVFGDPSDPAAATLARIWGRGVVPTNSIQATRFLVGDMPTAAMLRDREQANVQFSRHDGDNFVKNMVTILAEERLALLVFRPEALVRGNFN